MPETTEMALVLVGAHAVTFSTKGEAYQLKPVDILGINLERIECSNVSAIGMMRCFKVHYVLCKLVQMNGGI